MRPVDLKSTFSEQLKMTTILPRFFPSSLTVSVFPVPAGPVKAELLKFLRAVVRVIKQRSVRGVMMSLVLLP
jgi:hypothetical protein